MGIIEINNFSHTFGDKVLFEDSSFVLNPKEKIGLTGVNGAGKSTLLKIIMGEVLLDKGTFYKNPKYTIKYLDQHAEVKGDDTIKQYLSGAYKDLFEIEEKVEKINEALATEQNPKKLEKLLNQSGEYYEFLAANNFYAIDSEIEKVCFGVGITGFGLNTQVKTLSGGQRAKVMLAKLLLESPDVMVLDEPTNFLDVSHIEWLTKFINSSDKAFIIVSHDTHFLNDVVTNICDVDNNRINKYSGNYEKCMAIKEAKRVQHEKNYEQQQREIKKMEDYIARNKARAATANMAHSREKMLSRLDIINPPSEQIKPTFSFKYKPFAGNLVLKVSKLQVGYNGKTLLKPLSFEVNNGERIAITGFNGIGKSTLLKTIIGQISAISGNSEIARNIVVGYYEQENEFNNIDITPVTYVSNKFPKLSEKEVRTALNKCGLNAIHCKKSISKLSGGEQSKIKICVLTLTACNLLILDEPTNHLDVFAIDRLEQAIKEFDGTVIFVSHSKPFVNSLATKIIDLEKL